MTCPADQHTFPPSGLFCSVCHGKRPCLAQGEALPYPAWQLAQPHPPAETPHSTTLIALDPATGRQYLIREYLPDLSPAEPGSAALTRNRRFIEAAKSLREIPIPAMRLVFPYTRGARLYTVAEPLLGTPLRTLIPGTLPEPEATRWLESILRALQRLHTQTAAAGLLFHGNLQPSDVLVQGTTSADAIHLQNALYLENLLIETPLTPEQAIVNDVRAAAHITLNLLPTPARPHSPLTPLRHLPLAATLDYILAPANNQTPTAAQALTHLHLLQTAHSPADYERAYQISGSPRLKPLLTPPPKAPTQQPVQEPAPLPVRPHTPPVPPTPPPPPPQPNSSSSYAYTPQPQPASPYAWQNVPTPSPYRPDAASPRRRSGCLYPLSILAFLGLILTATLIRSCSTPAPEPRAITFTALPNPVTRGQTATLSWTVTGYAVVRLNGAQVGYNGTQSFTARRTTTYKLVAITKEGRSELREVTLTVLGRERPESAHPSNQPDASPAPESPPDET